MCNQNIISNKFNLKLVITFSSYWCTAIFMKSRSMHYVLKKQRKSIKSEKRHWREERRSPRKHTHRRKTTSEKITTLTNSQQGSQNRTAERTTLKKGMTLPEQKNDTQWQTSKTSAFQNGTQKNDVRNDAHRDSQTTARIWKTTGV